MAGMAHITMPSTARVSEVNLRLEPRQDVLRDQFGKVVQVVRRGAGFWRGVLVIGRYGATEIAAAKEVDAWVQRLEGAEHTFDVPLNRSGSLTAGSGTALARSAAAVSGGNAVITATVAVAGLVAGDWITTGGQAYQVVSVSGAAMTCVPARAPGSAAAIEWENPILRARRDTGVVQASYTHDGMGPWSIPFVEA